MKSMKIIFKVFMLFYVLSVGIFTALGYDHKILLETKEISFLLFNQLLSMSYIISVFVTDISRENFE